MFARKFAVPHLPASSFIEFRVRGVSGTQYRWINRLSANVSRLPDAVFVLPDNNFDQHNASVFSIALGERYGGAGVGGNLGGVRCGIVDEIQIKGIGRNPLASPRTDYWHTHGALSLQDAVKEAIWGEILHAALPHGAVRGLAVIDVGSTFAVEIGEDKQPGQAKRALLLREFAIRPAHYMRSIFASPDPAFVGPSDVDRTKAALESLLALERVDGSASSISEALSDFLLDITTRAAEQLAASRAKRLMHGSLIASNWSIDGRWLDFGTTTALGDFGQYIVAPGGIPVWDQHQPILEALYDWRFYIGKYLRPHARAVIGFDELRAAFWSVLIARERIEFLKLTGFPEHLLVRCEASALDRLYRIMRDVFVSGNRIPCLYFGDDRYPMQIPSGRYHLPSLMRICGLSPAPEVICSGLQRAGLPQQVATDFSVAFWSIKQQVRSKCNPDRDRDFMLAHAINTVRKNMALDPLYRRNLDGVIHETVTERPDCIGALIDTTVSHWAAVLGDDKGGTIDLAPWLVELPVTINTHFELESSEGALTADLEQKIVTAVLAQLTPAERELAVHLAA